MFSNNKGNKEVEVSKTKIRLQVLLNYQCQYVAYLVLNTLCILYQLDLIVFTPNTHRESCPLVGHIRDTECSSFATVGRSLTVSVVQ